MSQNDIIVNDNYFRRAQAYMVKTPHPTLQNHAPLKRIANDDIDVTGMVAIMIVGMVAIRIRKFLLVLHCLYLLHIS